MSTGFAISIPGCEDGRGYDRGVQRWEDLIERRIREAMEVGEFDDLPGEGRPQDLSVNPFEDPELALGHRMLRNAGMAPAWIEERRDVVAAVDRARRALRRTGDRAAFEAEVPRLNARILSSNLRAPGGVPDLPQLSLAAELARAGHTKR
jgi:hypothetical protein